MNKDKGFSIQIVVFSALGLLNLYIGYSEPDSTSKYYYLAGAAFIGVVVSLLLSSRGSKNVAKH